MHNGVLTMSAGGHDVHSTITPYLSPDWAADYTYEIRAVMRTPNGDDASWKHNVALTFMVDLWHSAGFTKQDVESLILGQLRHQKVLAVAVVMMILLLFLQKQNLAFAVYLLGSVLSLPD
jgi:hypothetical protein